MIDKDRVLRLNCPGYGEETHLNLGRAKTLDNYQVIIVNPVSLLHLFDKGPEPTRRINQLLSEGNNQLNVPDDALIQELINESDARLEELIPFLSQGGLLIYFLCRPFVLAGPNISVDNYDWLSVYAPATKNPPENGSRQMSSVSHGRIIEPTDEGEQSEMAEYLKQPGVEWNTIIRSDFLSSNYSVMATAGSKKCIAAQFWAGDNGGKVIFLPAPYSPDFDKVLMSCVDKWYQEALRQGTIQAPTASAFAPPEDAGMRRPSSGPDFYAGEQLETPPTLSGAFAAFAPAVSAAPTPAAAPQALAALLKGADTGNHQDVDTAAARSSSPPKGALKSLFSSDALDDDDEFDTFNAAQEAAYGSAQEAAQESVEGSLQDANGFSAGVDNGVAPNMVNAAFVDAESLKHVEPETAQVSNFELKKATAEMDLSQFAQTARQLVEQANVIESVTRDTSKPAAPTAPLAVPPVSPAKQRIADLLKGLEFGRGQDGLEDSDELEPADKSQFAGADHGVEPLDVAEVKAEATTQGNSLASGLRANREGVSRNWLGTTGAHGAVPESEAKPEAKPEAAAPAFAFAAETSPFAPPEPVSAPEPVYNPFARPVDPPAQETPSAFAEPEPVEEKAPAAFALPEEKRSLLEQAGLSADSLMNELSVMNELNALMEESDAEAAAPKIAEEIAPAIAEIPEVEAGAEAAPESMPQTVLEEASEIASEITPEITPEPELEAAPQPEPELEAVQAIEPETQPESEGKEKTFLEQLEDSVAEQEPVAEQNPIEEKKPEDLLADLDFESLDFGNLESADSVSKSTSQSNFEITPVAEAKSPFAEDFSAAAAESEFSKSWEKPSDKNEEQPLQSLTKDDSKEDKDQPAERQDAGRQNSLRSLMESLGQSDKLPSASSPAASAQEDAPAGSPAASSQAHSLAPHLSTPSSEQSLRQLMEDSGQFDDTKTSESVPSLRLTHETQPGTPPLPDLFGTPAAPAASLAPAPEPVAPSPAANPYSAAQALAQFTGLDSSFDMPMVESPLASPSTLEAFAPAVETQSPAPAVVPAPWSPQTAAEMSPANSSINSSADLQAVAPDTASTTAQGALPEPAWAQQSISESISAPVIEPTSAPVTANSLLESLLASNQAAQQSTVNQPTAAVSPAMPPPAVPFVSYADSNPAPIASATASHSTPSPLSSLQSLQPAQPSPEAPAAFTPQPAPQAFSPLSPKPESAPEVKSDWHTQVKADPTLEPVSEPASEPRLSDMLEKPEPMATDFSRFSQSTPAPEPDKSEIAPTLGSEEAEHSALSSFMKAKPQTPSISLPDMPEIQAPAPAIPAAIDTPAAQHATTNGGGDNSIDADLIAPVTATPKPEELIRKMQQLTSNSAPSWCTDFSFPFIEHLRKEHAQLAEQLKQVQTLLSGMDARIETVETLKMALLTGEQDAFLSASQEILTRVGWQVQASRTDPTELWLVRGEKVEAICRVVRSQGSTNRTELAQLAQSVIAFWDKYETEPKGILLTQNFSHQHPSERAEPDFGQPLVDAASKKGLCLMSSLQLLGMFKEGETGQTSAEEMRKRVLETSGKLGGFALDSSMAQAATV